MLWNYEIDWNQIWVRGIRFIDAMKSFGFLESKESPAGTQFAAKRRISAVSLANLWFYGD